MLFPSLMLKQGRQSLTAHTGIFTVWERLRKTNRRDKKRQNLHFKAATFLFIDANKNADPCEKALL
ncbi:MAG: hypothetical protein AB2L14_03720 [Candidatus Xenobiia bacterium LiM19]